MNKPSSIRARVVTESAAATTLTAYVFDRDGALRARLSPDADGGLAIPAEIVAGADRLIIGPELTTPSLARLAKLGAIDTPLARLAAASDPEIRIKDAIIFPWRLCTVRGVLVKQVTVDGTTMDLPVPNARLEVFEVDPLLIWIPRLPLDRFERIRELLLTPPPPFELPSRFPPLPGPRPIEPDLPETARLAMAMRAAQAEPELVAAATAGSRIALEAALARHLGIIRPLLCLAFPRIAMTEVAETTTDEHGRFEATFIHDVRGDAKPDLYFRAHQTIGGVEVQIYGPTPIGCHTYWDYTCGTELTLRTRDPRAVTGGRDPGIAGPGDWGVAFVGVGAASTAELGGVFAPTGSDLDAATPLGRRYRDAATSAPWGGSIGLRFEFAQALEALGAVYYRVMWRRQGATTLAPLVAPVTRYYKTETTKSDGTKTLAWIGEPMGPVPATAAVGYLEGLCRIPYASIATAKGGVWDTPTGGGAIRAHLTSAGFDSVAHASGGTTGPNSSYDASADRAGRYEFLLSLHQADGSELVLGALGRRYVAAKQEVVYGPSTIIETAAVGAHMLDGGRLKITLDLDNNHCSASLAAPALGSTVADACCGVLDATAPAATVTLGYAASQPHGNDTYRLSMVRAATGLNVGARGEGSVSGAATPTAGALMADNKSPTCPVCTLAGFAEHLYVEATATDGWGRLTHYDASATRAFVIKLP